jgi:hypothetical protein
MKQLRGLYAQTYFTFRTALVFWPDNGLPKPKLVATI